jgi:SAM-dependent methyltransferase
MFPQAFDQPALIDFDNSIVDRDAFETNSGASYSERKQRRLSRALRRLAFGRNQIAETKVSQVLDDIKSLKHEPRLLVIGGGAVGNGAASLYQDPDVKIIGTDIYRSTHTTLIADGHRLPFADESIDGVWIQAVLEHVLDPQQVVAEIHRVLRTEGTVFADTPFMQQVHEGAYDFTRFTMSGHRWLFRNFTLIDAEVTGGAGLATLWSIRYLIRTLTGSAKLGLLAAAPWWWLRFADRLSDRRNIADAASAVYFYGRKCNDSITPKDVIAFYEQQKRGRRRTT